MNTMRPSAKKIAMGWSFSLGTVFGALATLGLFFFSPGIHKLTADASLQSRPIAGRPPEGVGAPAIAGSAAGVESDSVGRSAPSSAPDAESSSADMLPAVPGHPELTLQLD